MHRWRAARQVVPTLLAGVLLVGCSTPAVRGQASPADTGTPAPGADGVGDPYFPQDGNGGYLVDAYDLDLGYDPATDVLTGTATVEARATQALSSFHLDLQGLTVRSVTVDGRDATWERDGGELVVTPARPVRPGSFRTVVRYDGVPEPVPDGPGTSGFVPTADGAVVAGQPDVAATWFPANDHPSDPAAVDLEITVPAELTAVSAGVLVGQTTDGGTTTWHWRAEEPMATYLLSMAIGDYRLTDRESDGVRWWDAVAEALFTGPRDPSPGQVATEALQRQPEVLDFLAGQFGPYPFGAAGGVVTADPDIGFALESQTRPVYGPAFFTDARSADQVVVHELTHQWFGDDVHLAGWQHIWLNEGFATYGEWLWAQEQGGRTVQEQFDELAALPADSDFWTTPPGDPGPATDQLFSSAVYLRGAMTLVALGEEIGADALADLLRAWAATEAGHGVTTADFVALAEERSGRQLDDFFDTWLQTPQKPPGLD